MAEALNNILGNYVSKLDDSGCARVKCIDLIVITDGAPGGSFVYKVVLQRY